MLPIHLPPFVICPIPSQIGLFDADAPAMRTHIWTAFSSGQYTHCRIFPLTDGRGRTSVGIGSEGGEASETNRLFSRREFVVLYDRKSGRESPAQ